MSGRFTREMWKNHPEELPGSVQAYLGEENFTRLERCAQLAEKHNCEIPQIALAFEIDGPMNVFPILGAANKEELESSLRALDVKLTKEECEYLDLKRDEL